MQLNIGYGLQDKLTGYYPFIFFRKIPEHRNDTTLFGGSIISPPVAGFLPLRPDLFLTQNLPNPLIRTSSPDSRVDLISSRIVSTVPEVFFLVNPFCSAKASIKSDLVRVMVKFLRFKLWNCHSRSINWGHSYRF